MRMSALVTATATHVVQEIDKRGICQSRLISSVAGAAIFTACLVCKKDLDIDEEAILKSVSTASGAADATIKVSILYNVSEFKTVDLISD
jgi:transcription initiation factor TFIIIB Brf1 subunit/transcription initiation factor TFIIB